MVVYIVMHNFFVSFEVSGGSWNPSKYFEINKWIREIYPIFNWKFNC